MITARDVKLLGDNWELDKGTVTLFAGSSSPKDDSSAPMTKDFDKKSISVSEDVKDIQKSSGSTDSLNLSELKQFIKRNKEAGLDTLRYEVDYFAKFSFGFAAFVMSSLGIPFSVSKQRAGGSAFNVGITIALAFGYWAAYSSGITLGRHGALPPLLAVSVPNIAMVILSGFFMVRMKR